jgi:hypothetical protein
MSATATAGTTALLSLLSQLRDTLTLMPAPVYRARPAARVCGSIGEHVRHCLDHVATLVAAPGRDELSYDHRSRGTTLEIDPQTAVTEIERLSHQLSLIHPVVFGRTVRIASMVDAYGGAVHARSTLARELAFVIQHTVHHCASIALLLEWQGCSTAANFGVAASTLHARRRAS